MSPLPGIVAHLMGAIIDLSYLFWQFKCIPHLAVPIAQARLIYHKSIIVQHCLFLDLSHLLPRDPSKRLEVNQTNQQKQSFLVQIGVPKLQSMGDKGINSVHTIIS